MAGGGLAGFHACWKAARPSSNAWPSTTAMDQCTMFARLAPSLSRMVARLRSAWLACSPTVGPTTLPSASTADVDRLRRLFDHDGLAEGRVVVEPLGVDVPCAHVSPPENLERKPYVSRVSAALGAGFTRGSCLVRLARLRLGGSGAEEHLGRGGSGDRRSKGPRFSANQTHRTPFAERRETPIQGLSLPPSLAARLCEWAKITARRCIERDTDEIRGIVKQDHLR
jgi:hypothetical protein